MKCRTRFCKRSGKAYTTLLWVLHTSECFWFFLFLLKKKRSNDKQKLSQKEEEEEEEEEAAKNLYNMVHWELMIKSCSDWVSWSVSNTWTILFGLDLTQ